MKIALKLTLILLLITNGSIVHGQKLQPESKIITQTNSPVKITSYATRYVGSSSSYVSKGIHHELEYENVSQKIIVAAQFGLVSFDIWNEYLDRTGGVTMTPLAIAGKNKGEWVSSSYGDFSFQTGVAYVSKVRFDDGEIWNADISSILAEMKKIEKDFDAGRLKKKDDGKP